MVCGQCSSPLVKGSCPNCSPASPPSSQTEKEASTQPSSGRGLIPYDLSSSFGTEDQQDSTWKKELRKKIDAHKKRKSNFRSDMESSLQEQSTANGGEEPSGAKTEETLASSESVPEGNKSSSSLNYNLTGSKSGAPRRKVIPLHPPDLSTAAARHLARPTLKNPKGKTGDNQRRLDLDLTPAVRANQAPEITRLPPTSMAAQIHAPFEILFSRLLTGLIDLALASLLGSSLVLIATSFLSGNLFSTETAIACAIASGALSLFSSFFLLYLCGQTPGMLATDLRLVGIQDNHPPLLDIAVRVLLFPIVAVTLVGLLWAVFDEKQRCWHDHASRTKIAPVSQRSDAHDSTAEKRA
jgi:uncharacterized RDD family membrane protein YckC